MIKIDTAQKDWQKKMEFCMKKGDRFLLFTKDKKLAKSLESGEINAGVLKLILFGSSVAGAAATAIGGGSGSTIAISSGVVGLKGVASAAASTTLLSFVDPEPVSKVILAVIAGICFALGAYYVYGLITMLISKKYKFKLKRKGRDGDEWEFEAEPA